VQGATTGEYISAGARDEEGHSGERNPGNARNELPPFIRLPNSTPATLPPHKEP
jgi:hypothetical protein